MTYLKKIFLLSLVCAVALMGAVHARNVDELMATRKLSVDDITTGSPVVCRKALAINALVTLLNERNYEEIISLRRRLIENSVCHIWTSAEIQLPTTPYWQGELDAHELHDRVLVLVYEVAVKFQRPDGSTYLAPSYLARIRPINILSGEHERSDGFL